MSTRYAFAALAVTAGLAAAAPAQNVLILSSSDPVLDGLVQTVLQAGGLTATVGPEYVFFDNTVSLAGVDVVYLQANDNWPAGNMPASGQTHLHDFVQGGGGLVTCEWVVWKQGATSSFAALEPAFPVTTSGLYGTFDPVTFTLVTADPVMAAGVPSNFQTAVTSYAGTETELGDKVGAVVFFSTGSFGGPGLAGWDYQAGRVASFSTVNGEAQLNNPDFSLLLVNSMKWAAGGAGKCYADCNLDGALNLADFGCFQTKFALGDPYADCNADLVLNLADFGCFQTAFALGCP